MKGSKGQEENEKGGNRTVEKKGRKERRKRRERREG